MIDYQDLGGLLAAKRHKRQPLYLWNDLQYYYLISLGHCLLVTRLELVRYPRMILYVYMYI